MRKPKVDKDLCIGALTCAALAPEVFKIVKDENGEKKAEVIEGVDYAALKEKIDEAIAACPTAAITWEEVK